MSKKNDELKEIYDEYQKNADIDDKTPDVSKKQGLPKFKAAQKITAIILAGAVLVAAGVAIKNRKGTSNPTPVTTSDTTSPTDGDTTSDYEYVLVENFDINDNEQLKKVAQDIKNNSGTELSVDDVENMLEYYNGTISRDDFSSSATDVEIYEKIITYISESYNIMQVGVSNYENEKDNLTKATNDNEDYNSKRPYDNLVVSSAALLNSSTTSREYQINLSNVLENTLEDISQGDTSSFDSYADEYYEIFEAVQNDDTIPSNEATILNKEFKAIYPIYSDNLEKDKQDNINEQTQSFDDNKWLFDVLDENLNIDYEAVVDEADKDGDFGYDLTPTTEKYNGSDLSDANNHAGSTGEEDKTEKVQTGGQNVSGSGSHETVSEATTSRPVVSTTTVNVPDKETTTKKEQGGKPVGTTEKETETTTIIAEETSLPGNVNDDESEEVPVYTEDEWQQEQNKSNTTTKSVAIGAVALMALSAGSMSFVKKYSDLDKTKDNSKKKRKK